MGADMYLNPPADPRGPEDHVVVNLDTAEVWGPYRLGAANSHRRKVLMGSGTPKNRIVVRKMKRP